MFDNATMQNPDRMSELPCEICEEPHTVTVAEEVAIQQDVREEMDEDGKWRFPAGDGVSLDLMIPLPKYDIQVSARSKPEDIKSRLTPRSVQGGFYQELFAKEGMAVVVPQADEQDFIHEKYMGELVKGVFLPATRDDLLAIAGRFIERDGIESLILGGTELPLILRDPAIHGAPLLDTTRIHVDAIVARLLS